MVWHSTLNKIFKVLIMPTDIRVKRSQNKIEMNIFLNTVSIHDPLTAQL